MASATLSPVERALKDSLNPETFRDVNLYAFSRRTALQDGSIIIDHPLPIVAIGSILKETEHFSKLLTSGFSEANPDAAGPIRQSAHPYEYDYDTDSDLEDFEEPASTLSPGAESSPTSASSTRGKAKTETADEEKPVTKQEDGATGASKRHQVLIPNVAYRTLKACVLYLYTGKITFLPFKSKRADRSFALLTLSDSAPLACSPKSAYRLAESYGITALQDLAYKEIVSRLNPENIVEETFSSFFGRYDRLREDAVSFMSQHYTDSAVQQSLPDIIDKIVIGDMPYAGGVLRSLLGLRVLVAVESRLRPAIFGDIRFGGWAPQTPQIRDLAVPTEPENIGDEPEDKRVESVQNDGSVPLSRGGKKMRKK